MARNRTARRTAARTAAVATKQPARIARIPLAAHKVDRNPVHPGVQTSPQQAAARAESKPVAPKPAAKAAARAESYQAFTKAALVELAQRDGVEVRKSWTKARIIEELTGVKTPPKPGTNAALKAQCAAVGIKGVSSLNKAALQESLAAGKAVKPAPKAGTVAEYKARLSAMRTANPAEYARLTAIAKSKWGRTLSALRRDELVALLG